MTLDLFFFFLALGLTPVVIWLYITGRLESAIKALSDPQPLNEQEQAEARARAERRITKLLAPLDRFADHPTVRRIADSRTYRVWIAPALTALYVAFNGAMIVAALFGYLHWSSGVLAFGLLLIYLSVWRALWLAANGRNESSVKQ